MFLRANTSPRIWGYLAFLVSLLYIFFGAYSPVAQAGNVPSLPSLFDTRERIAKPDLSNVVRVRFLTTVDFPPLNFIDKSGKLIGFQIDLVRELCLDLAIADRCQIEAVPYEELKDGLASGRGEAVIAGVKPTADLRNDFVFSRPFMQLPARFLQNTAIAKPAMSTDDLAGKEVGVVGNTVHLAMLTAFFPSLKPKIYPDLDTMLAALAKKEVNVVFSDGLKLSFWAADPSSGNCCAMLPGSFFSTRFLGEGLSVMVKKSDAKLATAFDHALLNLERNGRLNELYLRYFPNGMYE